MRWWWRPAILTAGSVVVIAVVVASLRLPVGSRTVWLEVLVIAASTGLLVAVTWWLVARDGVPDRSIVLSWGLGSGWVLGALWIAEIAFNNLTPHSISTADARGVLDDATWGLVGLVTVVVAAGVRVRTGRWRSGVRAGVWSGVASGLGAAVGGGLLVALFRPWVESDPLMLSEWEVQGAGLDLAAYVTRETMAGVWGHLWVLGIVQGALLGVFGATLVGVVHQRRAS